MNLRAKIYVEHQQKETQGRLDARLAFLKEKGVPQDKIQKDATVRKLRAQARKSVFRLASIAAQEKLNLERVRAKADKLAAEKAAKEEAKKEAAGAGAEKKEKKGKKEKGEKQEKAAGKKEKAEGKKEKQDKKAEKPAEQ